MITDIAEDEREGGRRMNINHIYQGHVLDLLPKLPDGSVQCCVTSPPYWGLRDYGVDGQLGLESTPEEYVSNMVQVFREVRRVMKDDGTLWLNIGDSYASGGRGSYNSRTPKQETNKGSLLPPKKAPSGLKPKDLVGIPWMLAFALRADGWYLRQDIIWAKKNCMPESVTDRCTRSHEYIFMLSKSPKYYYDHEAIMEPAIYDVNGTGTAARKARATEGMKSHPEGKRNGIRAGFKDSMKFNGKHSDKQRGHSRRHAGFNDRWDAMTKAEQCTGMRNKRSVWSVATSQFKEAHFATFPEALIVDCIRSGSRPGDIVLDPFFGAGTTGLVAAKQGRHFVGIDLNPEYTAIAERRIKRELGIFYQAAI